MSQSDSMVIQTEGLSKAYNGTPVLDGLTLGSR